MTKTDIPSPFDETAEMYERDYGIVDYKGKVVLDLGADRGSTASWFLAKGATKVIAVEGNRILARELKEICAQARWVNRIVPIEVWIKTTQAIEALISEYKPDVVKVDIEHWEILLANCKGDVLKSVHEWVMEIHRQDEYDKLVNKFLAIGFSVTRIRTYDWQHVTGVVQRHFITYFFGVK